MKSFVGAHRIASITFVVIFFTLLATVSPILAPARTAFVNGTGVQLITDQTYNATIAALIILMSALALALHRRDQIIELQEKLLRTQKRDIDIHSKAIHNHSIVCETNADGTIVDVSKSFENLFGYDRVEVLGKNIDILYEDDRHDKNFVEVKNALSEGQIYSGEQRLRTKSGKFVTTLSTVVPLFDEDGVHIKNISMRTDISGLRKSEADRFLTALLKKLQDEVYIYTVDTQEILFMNETALEKSGWTSEYAVTRKINDTADGFDEQMFLDHVQPILDGEVQAVTARLWRNNEFLEIVTRLHVQLDAVPVFVSVCRDISERKKIESEKLKTISYVSHELRSPLTSIMGALRLVQSGVSGELSPEIGSIIDVAKRNSERMLDVLSSILDFEKIRAGKMEISREPVDLVELVANSIEMNKGYADEYGVDFVGAEMPQNALILGSSSHLLQVVTNLMSNAAKFSPKGGKVVLELAEFENMWRLSVRDDGPGISPEDQKRVFDSFAQIDPADGQYRVGTGLGLTISKKIISLHSGEIGLESKVGEGTKFYFDIPKLSTEIGNQVISGNEIAAE